MGFHIRRPHSRGEGGPPKATKGTRLVNSIHDKGVGGGQRIRNFCGCHIWKPPYNKQHSVSSSDTKAILHAPTELGEQVPIDESDPDGESDDDHRKDGREHVEEGGFL